jgi:hypothetical protein
MPYPPLTIYPITNPVTFHHYSRTLLSTTAP